ncbi:unnamed protein product [Sphagnum jensenii]|uniref:phosphoenolpyruvate carboxykinase (ATP) n=1 Tax=Sphagnum jensenii TaxID=128206 RepID=A0ABP0VSZ8_9BRYO
MRRVMVQGLARFSSSSSSSSRYYTHASACLAAAETSTDKSATSGGAAGHVETIIFPREGPGVNYALNWALASKGVSPQGDAYRNLKEKELKKHNAAIPGSASPAKIYARGTYSVGAADISKAQFNDIFKEVTAHLSSAAKLYVHDGAVGSSPSVDVKVRTISDSSSAALILQRILDPAPTRVVSHDAFPLTVYVASNYSPTDHERLGMVSEGKGGSIVIDYDRSTMILWGNAVNDTESVKMSLAALAAPSVTSRDALPLFSRLLVQGGSTVLLFAPESLVQNYPALLKAAVSPDLGIVWSKDGVARLFATHQPQAANLYKTPSSLVLVTADSTGAVPDISKVTAEKAAALFVAGYNGEQFHPGYQPGPGSVDPVILAKGLSALLEGSNIPAFLVNASLLSENELVKQIEATVTGKLPKMAALKLKYRKFMGHRFPDLPNELQI